MMREGSSVRNLHLLLTTTEKKIIGLTATWLVCMNVSREKLLPTKVINGISVGTDKL